MIFNFTTNEEGSLDIEKAVAELDDYLTEAVADNITANIEVDDIPDEIFEQLKREVLETLYSIYCS